MQPARIFAPETTDKQNDNMKRKVDMRTDAITARHIAQALKTQAEFGYEYARVQLEALGVDSHLALALLAQQTDRRAAPTMPPHAGAGESQQQQQ